MVKSSENAIEHSGTHCFDLSRATLSIAMDLHENRGDIPDHVERLFETAEQVTETGQGQQTMIEESKKWQ